MIFVDTGPFLSRYLPSDQYHDESLELWEKLRLSAQLCCTSNLVLTETFTLLGRRTDYRFAAQQAQLIYRSAALTILRPTEREELAALALFEKYASQRVSFTDCVSFVLMRKAKVRQAFSFDAHFEAAGFTLWK